jgi:hypothetical protein
MRKPGWGPALFNKQGLFPILMTVSETFVSVYWVEPTEGIGCRMGSKFTERTNLHHGCYHGR